MICSVRYSPEARDDLVGILDYIGVELASPQAAARIVRAIAERIDLLSGHPYIGRELPETVEVGFPCRHFAIENYRVFYRLVGTDIFILRILHSRQNHMAVLFPEN